MRPTSSTSSATRVSGRRRFLVMTIAARTLGPLASASAQTGARGSGSLTKEQRDRMTPGEGLHALRKGNERFRTGNMVPRDHRDQQRSSAAVNSRPPWSSDVSTRGRRLRLSSTGYRRHI